MIGPLSIERVSTAERVADALREQLLSGAIPLGTPMRDGELSARAGVSRTTMREALAQLAREGLLNHSLHRGMEVAQLAADDVRDIYALRRVLETAGAQALLTDQAGALAELEDAVQAMAMATAGRDRRRVVETDAAFHTAIVAALGNRRLRTAMAGAIRELRLVLSLTDRANDDLDEQLGQHRALLDLLRARAPEAVAAVDAHLMRSEAMVCTAMAASDLDVRR
jgi:DNA-binding GntR family transcriptional regulator